MSSLAELLEMARVAGARKDWAQAAGGNVSVKDGGVLKVKASGCRLSEMDEHTGWVNLDLAAARAVVDSQAYDALPHAKQQDEAGKAMQAAVLAESPKGRPSLETAFHALGKPVCLHVHLVEALAGLALKNGAAFFEEALRGSGIVWSWVDYRPPGQALARLVRQALADEPATQIVLMKNHGVIAYADSAAEAIGLIEKLQQRCQQALGSPMPPALQAMRQREGWVSLRDPWARSIALGNEWSWAALCPDDFIYCGLSVPGEDAGKAVRIEDGQVYVKARDARAAQFIEELLASNAQARALGRGVGRLEPLDAAQGRELLNMDGEKYRQELR